MVIEPGLAAEQDTGALLFGGVRPSYRDVRCIPLSRRFRAALEGNDRDEHVFALTQSLELYDTCRTKMLDCDRKQESLMAELTNKAAKPIGKLSRPRVNRQDPRIGRARLHQT
ncbi:MULTISPECIES: hypothetical protein [unclassified Mesorhizobium]|uniref:hypothetical protein n=1 Tax=unclassified Mesorhizobium TaxID=325217 RepID=UPI00333B2022